MVVPNHLLWFFLIGCECYFFVSPLVVAVIKASELWAAMEPELLVAVRSELEPTSEPEGEENDVEQEKEAEDDRATAVMIAQYLRVNKYRCS